MSNPQPARVVHCAPGTREIKVARVEPPSAVASLDQLGASDDIVRFDLVVLSPHTHNGRQVWAGEHAPSGTLFIAEDVAP